MPAGEGPGHIPVPPPPTRPCCLGPGPAGVKLRSAPPSTRPPKQSCRPPLPQDWGCQPSQVLCISWGGAQAPALPGCLPWQAVASEGDPAAHTSRRPASCDEIMRSVVQHNWRTGQEQQQQQHQQLVVGYCMKASREEQLAGAGMLQLLPRDGVAFMPLTLGAPLAAQGTFHVLLHKASDQLEVVDGDGGGGGGGSEARPAVSAPSGAAAAPTASPAAAAGVRFSPAIRQLQAELAELPAVCVVDPLACTAKVGWRPAQRARPAAPPPPPAAAAAAHPPCRPLEPCLLPRTTTDVPLWLPSHSPPPRQSYCRTRALLLPQAPHACRWVAPWQQGL